MLFFLGATVLFAILQVSYSIPLDGGRETCMNNACVVRAGRLLNALNTEVNPCTNFAEFACGGTFLEDRSIGLDKSYGSATREYDLIENKLDRIFADETHKYNPEAPETKAHNFYEICKQEWFTSPHGLQLMDRMAHAIGVPDLILEEEQLVQSPKTYGAALRVLREQFGVKLSPVLLRMKVDGKCLHVVSTEAELKEQGTDLDLATLKFFKSKKESALLAAFKANYVELNNKDYCQRSEEYKFQDITLQQLINESPKFGWPDFLNRYDNNSMVEVGPCIPEISRQLAAIYEEYPQLTKKFLISLGMKSLWTRKDADETSIGCYTMMKRFFLEAVTSIVKSEESIPDSKPVAHMAEQMRRVLEERMMRADWLDKDTRDQYLEKLRMLRLYIGYPEIVDDKDAFDQLHSTLELSGTLPEDLMRVARWREQISSDRCEMDVWDQKILPLETNALYNSVLQSVAITLGQMRADGYDIRLPSSMNYAGIGSTAGHEIMHAFDSNFRLRNRWLDEVSPESNTTNYLLDGESCLVDFYSTLTVNDVSVNGGTTLGENIADVYGLQLSYEAWKREMQTVGPDPDLPGVEYSPEQIFFIAFAQANCDKLDKETLDDYSWDEHAPGYTRVIGSAAQSDEFAAAFNCSAVQRPKRCKLWDA